MLLPISKRSRNCIGQTTDDYCNWWKELANTSAQNMFKIGEYLFEKKRQLWNVHILLPTIEVVTVQGKQ
jgi:hypothetical protein